MDEVMKNEQNNERENNWSINEKKWKLNLINRFHKIKEWGIDNGKIEIVTALGGSLKKNWHWDCYS